MSSATHWKRGQSALMCILIFLNFFLVGSFYLINFHAKRSICKEDLTKYYLRGNMWVVGLIFYWYWNSLNFFNNLSQQKILIREVVFHCFEFVIKSATFAFWSMRYLVLSLALLIKRESFVQWAHQSSYFHHFLIAR